MRTPGIAFILILLAGTTASAQQGTQYYTPDKKADAPTFMNAEVVRIDRRANTVTFRSESQETTLTVEGEALSALATLRAGDKVVVGYRAVKDADGRETRIVTSVTSASPTSGIPDGRAVAVQLDAGSTIRARVLDFDARRRRVTVIDQTGGLWTLPVTRGIAGIDSLTAGANVALTLGALTGGGVNVAGIASLGAIPVFAGGVAFPPVAGQFVGFNPGTGILTLDTTTAGRVTFPVGSQVVSGLSGLTPGQNLSLTFDVIRPTRVGGVVRPLATITGVQPFIPTVAPLQAAVVPGAVTPVAPANTGAVAGTGAVGGAVVGAPVATSPYANPVPSIPGVTPVAGAVLPPAIAKEPLSNEEVGAMRAQGEADLDAAAVTLAAAAIQIDAVWAGFKNQCLSGFATGTTTTARREWYALADDRIPTPTDDACRALHADLQGRAQGFLAQVDTVEDAARKADVLPARVREVFERHKLR